MKLRLDFVTNSSSSSFVCYGVDKDDIKISDDVYLKLFDEYVKEYPTYSPTEEEIVQMSHEEKIEWVKDNVDEYEEDLYDGFTYDEDTVGFSPQAIIRGFPDEKIGDIYKVVAREINKKFGTTFTEKDVSYVEEVSYNG